MFPVFNAAAGLRCVDAGRRSILSQPCLQIHFDRSCPPASFLYDCNYEPMQETACY